MQPGSCGSKTSNHSEIWHQAMAAGVRIYKLALQLQSEISR